MPAAAKIIVKQGGKLIIDGGTISAYCSSLWKGIEVWGSSTQRQLSTLQGTISIINNGSISYADIAITTCKKDAAGSIDWTTTGGIVQCTGALFRNNNRAVEFLSYQNKDALGNPINNISYFTNCTFETISSLPGNVLPYAFITMHDVNGISVNYCNFRNTALAAFTSEQRGAGIIGFDAGFNILGTCLDNPPPCTTCPCVNQVYCRFDGLTEGINASFSVNSLRRINVNGNKFDNVQRGILCVGSAYSSISANTFTHIPAGQSSAQGSETYGSYMNGAVNFTISNNQFSGSSWTSTSNNFGAIVSNSINTVSDVSKNIFSYLYSGTQTQNNNGSGTTGLKISCNDYNGWIRFAWAINPQSPTGSIANQGQNCGSQSLQAGNTWNNNSVPSAYNQINSTIPFQYYAGFGSATSPTNTNGVTVNFCTSGNSNSNSCSTGGGFLPTFKGDSKYSGAKLSGTGIPDVMASDTSAGAKLFEQNNTIRRLLAADSADAALAILEADNSPGSKRIVFGEYLARRNMVKANAMFGQLPAITSEDTDFSDYYKLVAGITGSGKTLYQMNSAQETGFTKFAGSGSPVSYNAKAALMFAKNKKYNFIIERFTEKAGAALKQAQPAAAINADSNEAILDDNIPNPFNENSVVNSYVPANASSAYITVCDYLGKLVEKYKLQNGYNSTEVSGRELSGIYFYSLEIDGNKTASKKMVVVH